MIDWKRIWDNRVLQVGALAIAAMAVLRIGVMLPGRAVQDDFSHYYLASRLVLQQENPYTTPLAPLYDNHGFLLEDGVESVTTPNPPPFLWFFCLFAAMTPPVAFWTWVALQTVCVGALLVLSQHLLGARLGRRGRVFLWAGTLSSSAVFWHFHFSQFGLLLALLLVLGYHWQRSGRTTLACLAVASAGLLKLYPVVLLPWFIWRGSGGWRARAARLAVVMVFIGVVVLLTDIRLWRDFFQFAAPTVAAGPVNVAFNFSLPAFIVNFGAALYGFNAPAPVAAGVRAFAICVGAMVILVAHWWCWRGRVGEELEFSLLSVAMLLGSATARGHYLVVLVLPVAALATRLAIQGESKQWIMFVMLIVALNCLDYVSGPVLDRHLCFKVVANYIPLGGLLLMAGVLMRQMRTTHSGRVKPR